jgi:hypothetical protein
MFRRRDADARGAEVANLDLRIDLPLGKGDARRRLDAGCVPGAGRVGAGVAWFLTIGMIASYKDVEILVFATGWV